MPVDIMFGRPDDQTKSDSTYANYAVDLKESLACVHVFVHAHLNLSADKMKRRYDVGAVVDEIQSDTTAHKGKREYLLNWQATGTVCIQCVGGLVTSYTKFRSLLDLSLV